MMDMAEGEKRRVKRVFIDADTGKQISEQTVVTDAKDMKLCVLMLRNPSRIK